MSAEASDHSTSARLAKASERFNILAHELHIALAEASRLGPDADLIASISSRLRSQALDLAEITFAVAEDVVSASGDPRAERSAAALGRVARIIEPVFEVASELAAHVLLNVDKVARTARALESADLAVLDGPIKRLLADNDTLITGVGVATAPEALADHRLWMQWWVQAETGPRQLLPQLNAHASNFYDYPSAVWFRDSARDLAPHLAPPHFDDGGTGTWMVTATVPVLVRDRLLGVACAELTLERIGALVAPALRALPAPAALVSPEGLVVASTHPDLRPGGSAPNMGGDETAHEVRSFAEVSPGITVARSPALAWRMLADWSSVTA